MERTLADALRYAFADSSLGRLAAVLSACGLVFVGFDTGIADLEARFPDADLVEDPVALAETIAKIVELIERPGAAVTIGLDLQGTAFEVQVWNALRQVPAGTTVTYGEIAARLGAPRQAREVGEACAANKLAVVVPCHRVVKKDGSISGYRWGVRRKRALLEREHRVPQAGDAVVLSRERT